MASKIGAKTIQKSLGRPTKVDPKTGPVLGWLWGAKMIENGPQQCDQKSIKRVPNMGPKLVKIKNEALIQTSRDPSNLERFTNKPGSQ